MADVCVKWMTLEDLMCVFQLTDRPAASALARRMGGVKIGGHWRVPPEAVSRLRDEGAREADRYVAPLPSASSSASDQPRRVPAVLDRDWLDPEV